MTRGVPLLCKLLTEQHLPDQAVARRGTDILTFGRFRSDIAHNAERLIQAGCRCGAPVAEDTYWFTVGVFALLRAGADVAIPPSARPVDIARIRAVTDTVVTDDPTLAADAFVLEPGGEDPGPLGILDERCTISFHTSGSTGTPKMVTRPLAAFQKEIATLDAVLPPLPPGTLVSATVPHQHLYGMAFKVLLPLVRALPFSCTMHILWADILTELAPSGVLVTSPAHLTRLSGLAPLSAAARPALVFSAGAPLPTASARQAATTLGVSITECFGSTETGSIAIRPANGYDLPWQPLPGITLRKQVANLSLKSAYIGHEGWIETSDLIDLLPDGSFRFTGRSDRIVKIEGKRISLIEIEQALTALPTVAEAAVAFIADKSARLCAAVVLTEEGEQERAKSGNFRFGLTLRQALSQTVDPMGLPRHWRFIKSLPTTSLGKRLSADIVSLFDNHLADVSETKIEPDILSVRRISDGVEIELGLSEALWCLQGHFPGRPILPGVAQLDWAVRLADTHLGTEIHGACQLRVKFRAVIEVEPLLTLLLRCPAGTGKLAFEYRQSGQTKSEGSIVLDRAD